ncbi:DNA topoisomerase VI subunit B family protein [Bizionia myxarmorum]|uniref:SGNH/GDSL hydrolase family protein n=1 Tax=Bizionia myxarmorum TaxID=291186 RepID=A0A5D0RCQ0_9FLAO|nr:hypothetical protein [Bizionia myxarmorum]TYB78354.1 hypothetical protein ES674_00820 [Bizionia myxarmorum]
MNPPILKHIIKSFLLILLISFVSDKLVFFLFNKISDQVYTGQSIGKVNHYLEIKDSLDFIVFGSSRANHNINPIKISENSFNMGMDGRKLAYSATLIKLLPDKKKQTVLLHIDPEYAFDTDYIGDDITALSPKYNRNTTIKNEIDKLGQNNILQRFYWSIGYNNAVLGIVKNYLQPNYDYKTYSGYDPIYVSDNQREIFENILNKGEKSKDCESQYTLNTIYNSYLDEIKIFCKTRNKTLILFTSPRLIDGCKDDNLKLKQILKDKNLEYYDFTDFLKENKNLDNWKDRGHLSDKGAELFTEEIKKLLK